VWWGVQSGRKDVCGWADMWWVSHFYATHLLRILILFKYFKITHKLLALQFFGPLFFILFILFCDICVMNWANGIKPHSKRKLTDISNAQKKGKFNFPEKYVTQEVTAKIHTNLDSIPWFPGSRIRHRTHLWICGWNFQYSTVKLFFYIRVQFVSVFQAPFSCISNDIRYWTPKLHF